MPNHVSNKLEFGCDEELAKKILDEISSEGSPVDFNTLIPRPLHIYLGNTSENDHNDFNKKDWYYWNRENWGTKWNAYDAEITNQGGLVSIYFETAWSVPYPFIIAFANKYQLQFTYKFMCEGWNFWGFEKWKEGTRIERNHGDKEMFQELHIELMGDEPETEMDAI